MLTELDKLFAQLEQLDIKLWLEGERLRFDAPQGALTSELRTQLQTRKADIILRLQHANQDAQNQPRTYPFSFAQQHFWSLQQLNPNDSFYTVPFAFRLEGELNVDVLRQSFNAIVKRHEILRSTLQKNDDALRQVVQPNGEIDMTITVIANKTPEEQSIELQKRISDELKIPFDLAQDSCLRVRLFQLSTNEHILLLCLHILIYDQRSLNALLNEISLHYAALLTNKTADLPPLPLQYGDYAKEQQLLMTTPMKHRFAYWQKWFERGEPEQWEWQTQKIERAPAFEADILWQQFDANLMQQLKELAQNNGVTLYMTLLAAYSVLIYRYSACPDVIIGTTFANRGRWEFDGLIGSTLSVLSVRVSLHENPTWLALLKQSREMIAQAMTHQDIPFRAMMPLVQPERTQFTPLFHTILSFLAETAHNELCLSNLKVTFLEHIANPASRPDLYLTIWEKRDVNNAGLTGYWLPQKNIFNEVESDLVMRHFQELLQLMVQKPEQTITQAMNEISIS
jgi:hypothetical protein